MRKILSIGFLIAFLGLTGIAQLGDGRTATELFALENAPRTVPVSERISVASQREANIVFDRSVVASVISAESLTFPLFDGKTFTAERRLVENRGPDSALWNGRIVIGSFEGDVVLTFNQGYVAGIIYTPDGVYEITPRGERHLLMELDQAAFPECGGAITSESPETYREPAGAGVDSGDRVDVLVMFTTASKNILGGTVQAQTHAQQAVDAANNAYLNSKIRMRIRLVHAQEYFYTETSSASTDLSNLRSNATVQALRNTHSADLVAMIGEMQGVCGIGYLMGNANGNQNNGYSATARSCAVGNITFGHELGHNMGSHHNPENGGTPTYPYGFGHYVNGSFRTVMSYVDPCTSGCVRSPYFSNPGVIYLGSPTGIENARDNARSINNTAATIANYRYSGSSLTLVNFIGPDHLSSWYRNWLYWTSDNVEGDIRVEVSRNEGATWETLFESTPNDGSHIIFNLGEQTPLGRLRIRSIDDPIVTDSSRVNISLR